MEVPVLSTAPDASLTADLRSSDLERLEDVGFMTCMTLVLLGNYAQTGHFGGPLAYTPYNVAMHLAGPERGGLRFDYRRPKHPYSDKFMLAGGHCIPTCYALWMIMGQALERKFKATGDRRYYADPEVAILPIDALGFRRGAGALKTLLQDQGLADHPLFAQAKARGIKALAGHAESVDVTNDVNGGPSGVGVATAAGKAAFWDVVGAGIGAPKIIAFEGEFAMTEGHAQELKTQALALKVGKRLRVMISDNNAGIDDSLIGGVIDPKYTGYDLRGAVDVVRLERLHRRPTATTTRRWWRAARRSTRWIRSDRRPIALIGKTDQGLLAGGRERQDSRRRRSGGGLCQPSLRDEDELRVLRRAGVHLRAALRRAVPGHPRRRGEGCARAAGPVQDQHRRGDVGARSRRARRLAGRPPGVDRRAAHRRAARCASRSTTIRSRTSGCGWRTCRSSRRR